MKCCFPKRKARCHITARLPSSNSHLSSMTTFDSLFYLTKVAVKERFDCSWDRNSDCKSLQLYKEEKLSSNKDKLKLTCVAMSSPFL